MAYFLYLTLQTFFTTFFILDFLNKSYCYSLKKVNSKYLQINYYQISQIVVQKILLQKIIDSKSVT